MCALSAVARPVAQPTRHGRCLMTGESRAGSQTLTLFSDGTLHTIGYSPYPTHVTCDRCCDAKRAASSYLLLYERRDTPMPEQDAIAMIDRTALVEEFEA